MNFSKLFRYISLTTIIYSFLTSSSYAYIDPGLGSMLLQGLLVVIGAVTTFFYILREKVKNFFKKIFKKKER